MKLSFQIGCKLLATVEVRYLCSLYFTLMNGLEVTGENETTSHELERI
jgi:hypothetical protein